MTIEEIEAMFARKDELTAEEKITLVQAMMENPESRAVIVNGLISMDRMDAATVLMGSYGDFEGSGWTYTGPKAHIQD